MTAPTDPYRHFRLNFEQQRKRARDLLRAARSGDASAVARLRAGGMAGDGNAAPKLADAQRTIARELRFANWAALKAHIEAMQHARDAMAARRATAGDIPDGDRRTLHIRCGTDIREPLREAGFGGDFYEHSYPYLIGPVREGDDCLEQRAGFIVASYGDEMSLDYDDVLASFRQSEATLHESADYERVVIWSERDCYDQLVLVRLLGHYARQRRPDRIELINLAEFPGLIRFIGLGQLPPEALAMIWSSRTRAGAPELEFGLSAWQALASPDPRELAAIARSGTPALPLLGPALTRHLQELPSAANGLSLSESIALTRLERNAASLGALFAEMTAELDPLPGQGDLQVRDRVLALEQAQMPLIARRPGTDRAGRARPPWTDVLEITETGRSVLAGDIDWLSLEPPPRWVGGVEVGGGHPDWRWDPSRCDVVSNPARA